MAKPLNCIALGGSAVAMRFDYYRASFPVGTDADQVIDHLALHNPDGDLVEGRPRMGYEKCHTLRDDFGERWADVLHGGSNGVLVETSDDCSPDVVEVIRQAWPHHVVTRADVCQDLVTEEQGLFAKLHPELQQVVAAHGRVKARTILPDQRKQGTSYLIGSRQSETYIRVYQKPEELVASGKGHRNLSTFFDRWVRIEVEAKPQKDNRHRAAVFTPEEFWGLSRISRQVCSTALSIDVGKTSAIDYRSITAKERARRSLGKMFGNTLQTWKEELGSWAELGLSIRELLEELDRDKRRHR